MWALLRATNFFYNSIAISVAVVWFTYFVCVFQKVSFWWVYGSSFVYVRFFRVSEIFRVLQWVTGHLGLAQVFWVGLRYSGFSCGIAHSWRGAGRSAIILCSLVSFLVFPNFLISSLKSFSNSFSNSYIPYL